MAHIIEKFACAMFTRAAAHGQFPSISWNNATYEVRKPFLALATSHLKMLAEMNRDDDIVNAMRDYRADAASNNG